MPDFVKAFSTGFRRASALLFTYREHENFEVLPKSDILTRQVLNAFEIVKPTVGAWVNVRKPVHGCGL